MKRETKIFGILSQISVIMIIVLGVWYRITWGGNPPFESEEVVYWSIAISISIAFFIGFGYACIMSLEDKSKKEDIV